MARMAVEYSRNRNRRTDEIPASAPPPYTSTDQTKDSEGTDLPAYTVMDPYASLQQAPPPLEVDVRGQSSATEDTHIETSTLTVPEDVPLLSDEEQL